MRSVEIKHDNHPVVLAIPHTGNYIPDEILMTFKEPAKQLIDTDWNVHRLYDCHSIRSRYPELARILKALVAIAGQLTTKETCQHGYFS